MHEPFILETEHRGQKLELPAAFQRWGYTYRIVVSINEANYIFEPDEEGSFRVLGSGTAEIGLLQAIVEKLQQLQR